MSNSTGNTLQIVAFAAPKRAVTSTFLSIVNGGKTFAYTLQHALLWALLFVLLAHEQSRIESIHPFFTKPKLNGCQTISNVFFAHQHGSLANWYLIEHAVKTSLRRLFCVFRDSMTIAGDDVHQTQSCFFLWFCGRIELQGLNKVIVFSSLDF